MDVDFRPVEDADVPDKPDVNWSPEQLMRAVAIYIILLLISLLVPLVTVFLSYRSDVLVSTASPLEKSFPHTIPVQPEVLSVRRESAVCAMVMRR